MPGLSAAPDRDLSAALPGALIKIEELCVDAVAQCVLGDRMKPRAFRFASERVEVVDVTRMMAELTDGDAQQIDRVDHDEAKVAIRPASRSVNGRRTGET